jgi:hypothetical protein
MYFQPDMVAGGSESCRRQLPRWTIEPSTPFCAEEMACKISGCAAGMVNGRSAIRRAGATIPV